MSSADGRDGPHSPIFHRSALQPPRDVESHLLEALMYVLIEKGVLTRNDALSAIETVAHVKRGERESSSDGDSKAEADLELLQRLYASFEALADRPDAANLDADNVHHLRPPIHGNRPAFPRDD